MIVTVLGVPLRIQDPPTGDPARLGAEASSVDAQLAILGSSIEETIVDQGSKNPYFGSSLPFERWRALNPDAPLRYLVSRLAGYPTPYDAAGLPSSVRGLVDAARRPADPAAAWVVDEPGPDVSSRSQLDSGLLAPSTAILRLMKKTVIHETTAALVHDVPSIAAYASLGSLDPGAPPAPFVGEIEGAVHPGHFDARSIAVLLVPGDARSFVAAPRDGRSMAADLVEIGAGGVAGTVGEGGSDRLPHPQAFFGRYVAGATAAESFYASVPFLGAANVFIGDPLMRRFELEGSPRHAEAWATGVASDGPRD